MNTTVLTATPLDLGAGPHRKQTFTECKWTVDQSGALHVIREGGRGTAMSFAHGEWRVVTDGAIVVAAEAASTERFAASLAANAEAIGYIQQGLARLREDVAQGRRKGGRDR